jgi:Flp pilus assembly protein TadD
MTGTGQVMRVSCVGRGGAWIARAAIVATVAAVGFGCASNKKTANQKAGTYETVAAGDERGDSAKAEQHNAKAVGMLERGDLPGAEKELKDALAADVMCGPAHNNLGKVYFHQGKLYLAAWEFQYAMKLMPNTPEPRNNLGLVFESAGKLDDAVASYDEAMRLEPDNVQFIGNLARARVRRGDRDADVRELLDKLVMRETRPDWADWARGQLATMDAKTAPDAAK